MSKYELEESELRKLLSDRRVVLGERDPATLTCLSDLALCIYERGRFDEAEQMN